MFVNFSNLLHLFMLTSEKMGTQVPVFLLFFFALMFENYERCVNFFYEILILIKTKIINVCCFQIITNQINHDYLFQ